MKGILNFAGGLIGVSVINMVLDLFWLGLLLDVVWTGVIGLIILAFVQVD